MDSEKGDHLNSPLYSPHLTTTTSTPSRRFGSPERRVHPSPPGYLGHVGLHNAQPAQRGPHHFDHGAPFSLEHLLHHDHPLRHPNAKNWRSAYSVIQLHKKYKELSESGGSFLSNLHPTMRLGDAATDKSMADTQGELIREQEKVTRLTEENKQLQVVLDQKTNDLEEKTKELEEKTEHVDIKTEEIKQKDTEIESLTNRLEDMEIAMNQVKLSSEALNKKLSESGVDVDGLMEQLAEMEAFRQTQIAKAASRWKNAGLHFVFDRWKNNVSETVGNRRLIARFRARFTREGIHASFVRWHDLTKTEKRNRTIIAKFASRFSKQAESKCFHKWQHLVGENSRLKRLQQKVAKRFLQQKLSSAFHGWYNNVHEILYNRSVVLKFGLRMKNSHLISSFSAWHHFAEERVHVRHTMIKYLNAIVRADEVQALQQWKKWSNWYERHAHEQDSHNLTTKIASLEDELHSCKTELEEFRAVFNRKRDKFVIALKARVESNRVGSSFKTWRYYAHQRHSARRTINRLCNKQLAASWHSWIAHDSALKEDLHIRSMANAERAKERERKKVILNRTLKHMKQLKLSKTFKSWKATIDEYVHERFILNRFVSRWKNQDLHHRFTRMITFTKDSLHQKKTARKVLNRIARTAEVAAWSKWVHAVTMLREHDKEAQESERKKAHDDLVLERFVRRWRSMDLHTRFTSWKETWRSSKHKRDTQSQLADLRAEYESKIGGLQAARDAEREMRIKKTVAAWLNNMLSHCFHRWSELASRNQRERNVVAKFVLQWQKSGLVSAYRSWKYKIRHLKRSRRIVKNMRLSKGRRTLAKLFKVWKEASAATAKDRRLLIRFGQRWRNMGLTKVWLSWHEFVDSRKHARSLVKKVLSRVLNQKISSGFRAWCSFSLKYEANKALEKLKSNALLEKHKAASAELEAKQNSAKRMLRHMMQRNLAHKFRTWSTNVTEICRVREVVRKIGIKMMKSGMVAAFAKWQEMIDDRNLARKVLRILLNAKLNSAFKTWFAYSHWISKWTAENAVAKVQELTIALNRIRKRSVKTLLWDRYKEIMGTAMHAWYLTIVQHREAEHLRFEEAEHTRLEAALSREAAEHQKYENALAKGHDQEEALANLNIGLEKAKYLTQQEHLKFERAKKHDEEEHKRLEEALAREAAEHQKYEHAVEQGHDKDVALKNLEKGLEKAKQIAEDEHLKNIEEHKLLEKANDALAHKPKLARALISSVWHKHKSQLRSKEKGKHARSERKTQGGPGNMSALAIAKAGFRGIKGRTQGRVSPTVSTSRTSSPIPGQTATLFSVVASAEGNKKMTGGRMVQKTLEELNDLVHTFTTATDVEAQCLLLRDIAGRMVRADNVDMFVKDETSFWTMVPKERTLREKEEGVDVHKVCKKQSWPLNAKGGMVASSLLQGHIIDSENALMDNMYSASPDLSPEGGKRRDVTTLAVLVVPLMDKHGKTMGAIRASRGVSSRGAEDSFSSIDSLLLCILAAMVQCTWNFSGATHDALVLRSLTPTSNEKEEKNFTPIETNKQDEKRPAEEEGWQQILRDAIVEFDRSHAGVVSRLNGTRRRSPPPEIIQPIVSRIPHTAAPFSSAFRSTRDRSTRNAHTTGMFGNNAAGNGNFEQKIQSSYVSPMSMRSSTLGMNDLSNVYSPSLRPYGETNRGVVSFVHHNYHEEY